METKRINYSDVKNEQYIKFYKFLFQDEFKNMSCEAKLLYCILRDRINLSIKSLENGDLNWVDSNGNVFIYATIENIMLFLNCSNKKAIAVKKELIKYKLIEDIRTGINKPNKIYILNVDYNRKCKKVISGSVKKSFQEVTKSHSINNNIIKTNIIKTNNNNKEMNKNSKIIEEIYKRIKKLGSIKIETLYKLIDKYGIDKVDYYLTNLNRFNYSKNPIGFLIKAMENDYKIPENLIMNKPIQSYNFNQREYDEEFFDNIYENL
jgi:hypothetical protein